MKKIFTSNKKSGRERAEDHQEMSLPTIIAYKSDIVSKVKILWIFFNDFDKAKSKF